jgi:hypothetical protein
MKNVDWNKMAAISEVIGTIAVVVSLVFVVHSVNQNTDALRNSNLNHVYDRLDSLNSDIAADPQLSLMYANRVVGLTDIEASDAQFLTSMRRELAQWEQYYQWHRDGLLDGDDWTDWDDYYEVLFFTAFPREWWQSVRKYYIDEFASHVDQIYSQ